MQFDQGTRISFLACEINNRIGNMIEISLKVINIIVFLKMTLYMCIAEKIKLNNINVMNALVNSLLQFSDWHTTHSK